MLGTTTLHHHLPNIAKLKNRCSQLRFNRALITSVRDPLIRSGDHHNFVWVLDCTTNDFETVSCSNMSRFMCLSSSIDQSIRSGPQDLWTESKDVHLSWNIVFDSCLIPLIFTSIHPLQYQGQTQKSRAQKCSKKLLCPLKPMMCHQGST